MWDLPTLKKRSMVVSTLYHQHTGHTQMNGAVSIGITIETAPFFCVCPVYATQPTSYKSQITTAAAGLIVPRLTLEHINPDTATTQRTVNR